MKMKINIFICTIVIVLACVEVKSQTTYLINNSGKIIVSSGSYLNIQGNYQNESSGGITLNGTIQVSGNWTNNGTTNVIETPGTDGEVVFNGTGTQTIGGTSINPFYFEKITINSGSTTQIEAGKGVTAYGVSNFDNSPLILKTAATTNAFRQKTATFINKADVTGNITMELHYESNGSSAGGTGRALYFATPISNATANIFSVEAGSNLLWYQNENTRSYVKITSNTAPLTATKGYILRSSVSSTFLFNGPPNHETSHATVSFPAKDANHYYLFGNPFPSVLDWDLVDKSDNVSPTIYYRTYNTNGTMDVDTWNSVEQTGTGPNGVDGKIPPMQSVWIQCQTVGTPLTPTYGSITVTENERVHDWGNAGFIKSQKQSKNYLRLYLNSGNRKDELIISQSDLAENTFETRDSRKMFLGDATVAEFFTLSPENFKLVIQSVKPIVEADTFPLGIIVGTAGTYSFTANLSEFGGKENVFIWDKQTDSIQDLFINPTYTFASPIINDLSGSRFAVIFQRTPSLVTLNKVNICENETANLKDPSITKGSEEGLTFTYWLNPEATLPCDKPSNVTDGVYYIKATNSKGGYSISSPITVKSLPNPTVAISNPDPVCQPLTVDLTTSSITAGSTDNLSFTYWTDANATIPYNTPASVALSGTYYIKGTTSEGCSKISDPISVIINSLPNLAVSAPTPECEPHTIDLTSSAITLGSSENLTLSYWKDKDATIPFDAPEQATSGIYYIKAIDSNSCYRISAPITVIINPRPSVVINNPSPVVYPATINLTDPSITLGSTEGLSYSYWLDPLATMIYSTPETAAAGDYYIKGTVLTTGCYSINGPVKVTITTDIDNNNENSIKIYTSNKTIIVENCKPNSHIEIVDITGKKLFDGISTSTKSIIPFNFTTGIYIVKVYDNQSIKSHKLFIY